MKTAAATVRDIICFLSLLALSVVLAACGGGGTDTSSNPSGIASVNVSLAAAPAFPAGTSFTATPTAVETAANPVAPGFDNVWVKIEKVALLPANEGEGPDPNGEVPSSNSGPDHNGGFVTGEVGGKVINLKDLPSGQAVASFLDQIENVPAGTYGKIRVYYSDLWGERKINGEYDNVVFHPTANSHFDVHFVGGDLVIPVAPDPDPDGGIRFYDVTIEFVGLKIVENKNNVLMRPQVFATVGAVQYLVHGFADNVDKTQKAFDISTAGGRSIHVMFDDTNWAFKDNATKQQVDVDNSLGIAALRDGPFVDDGSLVDVYGAFIDIDTLFADNVAIIFTDWKQGKVAPGDEGPPSSGWNNDNTFEFRFSIDNVVFPKPSRYDARYDNNAIQTPPLDQSIIVDNTCVRARGYFLEDVGIEAFWVSWLNNTNCDPLP